MNSTEKPYPQEWKQVKGYEFYEVSNYGNVRRAAYTIRYKKGNIVEHAPRLLAPGPSKGYLTVVLSENGYRETYFVHRLVAVAFIDNPYGELYVNHINGNKKDNYVDNLEWVSKSEDMKHAYALGLIKK